MGETLDDLIVFWKEQRRRRVSAKVRKAHNATRSWEALSEALWLEYRVRLRRHTPLHYSIRMFDGETILWSLNIYPTTCRLYWDRQYPKHPFVKVSHPWTLATVVEGLVRALKKGASHG